MAVGHTKRPMYRFLTIMLGFALALGLYLGFISTVPVHAAEVILFEQLDDTQVWSGNSFVGSIKTDQTLSPNTGVDLVLKATASVSGKFLCKAVGLAGTTIISPECQPMETSMKPILFANTNVGSPTSFILVPSSNQTTFDSGITWALAGRTHSDSNWITNYGTGCGGAGCATGIDPYVQIGTNLNFGNLTIDSPAGSAGTGNITFSGKCPVVGGAELSLTLSDFNSSPISSDNFDIDCASDHTWTGSIKVLQGLNSYAIHDISCLDVNRPRDGGGYFGCFGLSDGLKIQVETINGINTADGYLLKGIYPACPDNKCDNLRSSDSWQFRFQYNIPETVSTADVNFALTQCTGGGFTDCTTTLENTALSTLDPTNVGWFDTVAGDITAATDWHYYIVSLEKSSVVKYQISFQTRKGDESVGFLLPGDLSCGAFQWFCDLFVPRNSEIANKADDFRLHVQQKIPFAIFYDIKDQFNTSFITTNTNTAFILPINSTAGSINVPVFDTGDTHLQSGLGILRPWIIWSLWLSFISYLWVRIKGFRP